MTSDSLGLSRRKFIMVGSAAIASPLLLNVAGSMAANKTAGSKTTEAGIAPKGSKIYYISDVCIGCHACKAFCPAQAIRFSNCRNEIDQTKCIHCGTCYNECNISAITETVLS
jgi:dissimilatory sulfite reductase (desulfoviridin) alpha/beta subunit